MTDERLARADQHAIAARASADRTGCVTPEALLALARRSGPEAERLATLDHAMACGACQRELHVLRAIEEAGAELVVATDGRRADGSAAAPVPLRPRARARGRFLALAMAASALLALGIVARVLRGPGDPPDVMRGEAAAIAATQPAPGETVGVPITFAWRPVPGASRYTVEIVAEDGRVAWATETTEPTATLSDPRALAAGAEYRWWVRVTGGSAQPGGSEPRRLRFRGE